MIGKLDLNLRSQVKDSHKDLEVWKMAIKLTRDVYLITQDYPKTEIYGISSQMRRASVSIGANIAEGAARQSTKDFIRFLYIAQGSASELDTLVEISYLTNLCEKSILNKLQKDIVTTLKMLRGLIQKLKLKSESQKISQLVTNH